MGYDYRHFEGLLYAMVSRCTEKLHILGCTNELFTDNAATSLQAATDLTFRTMAEPYLERNSLAAGKWWLSHLHVEPPQCHSTYYQYPSGGQDGGMPPPTFTDPDVQMNVSLCVPTEIYRVFHSEWPNVVTRALEFYLDHIDAGKPADDFRFPAAVEEDLKNLLRGTLHNVDHNLLMFFSTISQGIEINVVDAISCEKYEGGSAKCQLAVVSDEQDLMPFAAASRLPFTSANVRALRKQAEMGQGNTCLAVSGDGRTAFTRGLIPQDKAFCPIITIRQPMRWQLSLPVGETGRHSIQLCRNGSSFSIPPLTDEMESVFFRQLCQKTFGSTEDHAALEHMVSYLRQNAHQYHGVSILVAEHAEAEAQRLCNERHRGFQLSPPSTSSVEALIPFLTHLASIDGAILLTPEGRCVGFATILDGIACSNGEPARGARFNSSQTYLDNIQHAAIAVVISTDGSVDYLEKSSCSQSSPSE